MTNRTILVSNETTGVTDDAAGNAVAAWQLQITRDFAPRFSGLSADLTFWPRSKGKPPTGVEIMHLMDTSDQAGAEGYHELAAGGYPEGFAFVVTSGHQWPVTGSHELLEQLLDPFASWTAQVGTGKSTLWVILEDCDPVENDSYQVNGIPVSNFVLPAWFKPGIAGPWDFLGKLTSSLQIDAGGYVAYSDSSGNWNQYTGARSAHAGPTEFSRHGRYQLHHHRAARGVFHAASLNWAGLGSVLTTIFDGIANIVSVADAAKPVAKAKKRLPFSVAP